MRKLLVFLKDYKKETILAPLFKMLEATFELFVPLVVASMIDNGVKHNDTNLIFKMSLVLLVLAVIGLISSITAQYFAAKAAVGFSAKLKYHLFQKIQSLSFSQLDSLGTSSMITRVTSDVNQVQNGVNLVLRLFLRSPFIVFGAMIMAFTIDFKSAMIFVVTIPILSIVVFTIMGVSIPLYKKVQQNLDNVLSSTRQNITGIRVIRAFCQEDKEIKEFNDKNESLSSIQKYVGRISALMNPLTYIVINLAIIALIYTGAIQVNTGVISQGSVIALYNYMSQILIELIKLANLIITVTKSIACAKRIEAVIDIETDNNIVSKNININKNAPCVEFENVCLKYYESGDEALTDITFTANKGETIGIIGGTGSGKSSLVHLIPHFYTNTKGSVKIFGVDIKDWDSENLRQKIGIVMQKAVLFKGTIRDNMLWGKQNASEDEIYSALEIAQAKDFVLSKDGKLDHEVSQNGTNFSGGQRQRLTIARALIKKPEILILDDSASALDYATDSALRKALKNLDYNPCIFIVSQRTSSLQHSDKIIVLDDGHIVGIGKHNELLKNCEVYKEIYNSQYTGGEN